MVERVGTCASSAYSMHSHPKPDTRGTEFPAAVIIPSQGKPVYARHQIAQSESTAVTTSQSRRFVKPGSPMSDYQVVKIVDGGECLGKTR